MNYMLSLEQSKAKKSKKGYPPVHTEEESQSMYLSTRAKVQVGAVVALGLGLNLVLRIVLDDVAYQARTAPRPFATYNAGNPLGYGLVRDFRNYGAPYWGGVGSTITPPVCV